MAEIIKQRLVEELETCGVSHDQSQQILFLLNQFQMTIIKERLAVGNIKPVLEQAILEELLDLVKTIFFIIPASLMASLRHTKPDFSLFKRKSRRQRFANLIHLGGLDEPKAIELLRIDAENITKKIIDTIFKEIR